MQVLFESNLSLSLLKSLKPHSNLIRRKEGNCDILVFLAFYSFDFREGFCFAKKVFFYWNFCYLLDQEFFQIFWANYMYDFLG